MSTHRYTLEDYKGPSTRHTCPSCEKPKEFTRYVDNETGQHVHPDIGKCNREDRCGYHYTPSQYFNETGIKPDHNSFVPTPEPKKEPSFIDSALVTKTQGKYGINQFVKFLRDRFGDEATDEAVKKYRIGTSKKWGGSTIFWQIDTEGKVRTGKIMQYGDDGKRIKKPYDKITWVHAALNIEGFNLFQCLFGAHLLKEEPEKTVCLVESEKSAIIASIALPGYVWIATGGKHGARWSDPESFGVMKDRNLILFPDLGATEEWTEKIEKIKHLANISISDILEKIASDEDRENGYDIADYLLNNVAVPCMAAAPASEAVRDLPGPSAGYMVLLTKAEIKTLASQVEMYGSSSLTPSQQDQVGDYFTSLNPNYAKLLEVFDLQYGEPLELSAAPF